MKQIDCKSRALINNNPAQVQYYPFAHAHNKN